MIDQYINSITTQTTYAWWNDSRTYPHIKLLATKGR